MAVSRMPAIWVRLLGAVFTFGVAVSPAEASRSHRHYDFVIKKADYTRLCQRKSILTVNGQFPGPTIYARKGDVVTVTVHNHGDKNITIHWHGVDQPRNPWSDGPEFITQCPIQPGDNFTYKIILSWEEGTLWWHAHSDFDRNTVHGAIVIRPRRGTTYPFKKPHKEIPIFLGEWWKSDLRQVLADALRTGSEFNASDANTINGQPGDLFPCSRDGTFKLPVEDGKTYMLRLINAVFTYESFFSVAGHSLTVVGTDGSYVKPFSVDYIFIAPGQTVTALLTADRASRGLRNARYYMAARPLLPNNPFVIFNNSTATAVLEYADDAAAPDPEFPVLPAINDSAAADAYTSRLRSLASEEHPVNVPRHVQEHMLVTLAVNLIACSPDEHCQGPRGNRLGASLNNVSFEAPRHANILDAYYHKVRGVHTTDFPSNPPLLFNFTGDVPPELWLTKRGTKVKVLEYGTTVEVVLQNTAILGSDSHPMHLHGFSFYVVGTGSGNFDRHRDPAGYNLVDPPYQNTVAVPSFGWSAIRFRAENPGVWFMHCHIERHMAWGMDTVFIVKDGNVPEAKMLPPPPGMPRC
ncbi:laccase-21-like [Miscanthus floridulus]|uniref:laccase-21-like n=1 Tax=Miscanthus floridulus TaxID=154761 RepID=UPI003458F0DE